MSNKLIALVALFGLTIFALPAFAADDDVKVNVGAKAGWLFLQDEPLSDIVENSWLVGADLTVWMPNNIGFGADVKFSLKNQDNADIDNFDFDMDWKQVPVNLNLYYRFVEAGQELTPYVGAGFSMVWTDIKITQANVETAQDEFAYGANAIVGLQYQNFFVEGQYIWAETDSFDQVGPLMGVTGDDKIQVGGFNFAVGYRF